MFVVPSKMYVVVFVYNIVKHSPGLFVCLTMVDVPGGDEVAGDPGEERMGETDEDGVWEMIGVLGGDGVKQPSGVKKVE